jgi:hypothetical protein
VASGVCMINGKQAIIRLCVVNENQVSTGVCTVNGKHTRHGNCTILSIAHPHEEDWELGFDI